MKGCILKPFRNLEPLIWKKVGGFGLLFGNLGLKGKGGFKKELLGKGLKTRFYWIGELLVF